MLKAYSKPFICVGFGLISTILVLQRFLFSSQAFSSGTFDVQGSATVRRNSSAKTPEEATTAVPNVVHFIHLVEQNQGEASFEFEFRHFIALYSAWHFLNPETIYIHTNVEDDIIKREIATSINPYTQAIGKISNLKFVHCTPPTSTTTGKAIAAIPNVSDFVRTDVLVKYGGTFLDEDVYVLRDLTPLRRSGFENVIGRQKNDQICPAVLLSTRNNRLMKAYHALQDVIFDGRWATHATDLLTTMAKDFSPADNQVLVLPQDSFFPLSWEVQDLKDLYGVHEEIGEPAVNNRPIDNTTDFIKNFQLHPPNTWQRDWRLSYTLHGWFSALLGGQTSLSADEIKNIFGAFDGINLEYVLAQNSNFARAVYPAVKHALDNGFLDGVRASLPNREAPPQQQQKELGGAVAP